MKISIKVTNQELFDKKVSDVNINTLRGMNNNAYHGNVAIETEESGWIDITGEHGANDYEEDYGFVIECFNN